MTHDRALARAAAAIAAAPGLIVAAGAGMGVDSGLPDFRGDEGFWQAYPPFASRGLSFVDLANPRWFRTDPHLAWGFYGHRLHLYRDTVPHRGFGLLADFAARTPRGAFVFTSNVDGQFQAAGYDADRVVECHGSLMHLQCTRDCGAPIRSARGVQVTLDEATFRAAPPLPRCPSCDALGRPNVLMFGDWGWDGARTSAQERRLRTWLEALEGPPAIVECGAGRAVPTVRSFSEGLVRRAGATLIRINPREPEVPSGQIGLPLGALAALQQIAARLG